MIVGFRPTRLDGLGQGQQAKFPEDTNHFPVMELRDDYKPLSQTTWELGKNPKP
jgi:hypothetical protein